METPRTTILSYALGTGHKRVGEILAAGLSTLGHACDHRPLEQWVPWEYDLIFRHGYLFLALRVPAVWGAMYASPTFTRRGALALPFMRKRAVRAFGAQGFGESDLVVATQYNAMEIAADWKRDTGSDLKLAVVITDYDVYPLWPRPEVDLYLVPHPDLLAPFLARGIPQERLLVTGIPILEAFDAPQSGEGASAALGLPHGVPTVMVFGGGGGFGPMEETVDACLKAPGWQVIAVCGNNQKLRKRLVPAAQGHPTTLRVLGYRKDIPALMAASDVVVTKGGGLSLTEAISTGVRTVVLPSIPGQEEANIAFMARRGWVEVCKTPGELPGLLARRPAPRRRPEDLPSSPARAAAQALDRLARRP